MLAATFTTAIVFFPVIFLYGVSRFLFTALALAVVLSLFASYLVAMTVVPLFCARFIKKLTEQGGHHARKSWFGSFEPAFNHHYDQHAEQVQLRRGQGAARPAGHRDRHHGQFCRQPGAVSHCSVSPSSRAPIRASS